MVTEACRASSEAAGGLVEPLPDGLSARGVCVFATSQCEFQSEHALAASTKHVAAVVGAAFRALFVLQVEVPQMDQLLSQLEDMSCTCSHPLSYTSAAKCFAGLVNKRPQGQLVNLFPLLGALL